MEGKVLLPTTSRFKELRATNLYIQRVGFTGNARKTKTYVIYANGDAPISHSLLGMKFYPRLEPGAEIVVPEKPDRERITPAAWLGIASDLAAIAILVQTMVNDNNSN